MNMNIIKFNNYLKILSYFIQNI